MLVEFMERYRPRAHKTYPHLRWFASLIERCAVERKDGLIETPPRTFKTETTAMYGTAWAFESHPDGRNGYFRSAGQFGFRAVGGTAGVILSQEYQQANPHVRIIQQSAGRFRLAGMERSLDDSYAGYGLEAQGMGRGFDTVV